MILSGFIIYNLSVTESKLYAKAFNGKVHARRKKSKRTLNVEGILIERLELPQ